MRRVAELLQASGVSVAEARALLAHRTGRAREWLIAHPEHEIDAETAASFLADAARRRRGEPLAYLVGEREFYSRRFVVNPGVLVPRPETEVLVRLAVQRAAGLPAPGVLDLGTGSGCIGITLALEMTGAAVVASDISGAALEVARANAKNLGARVAFVQGDWYAAVQGRFDLIVANPPYVAPADPHLAELKYEPAQALAAPDQGLACLRRIVAGAPPYLNAGGWLLVEHGYDQAAAVREMFAAAGFDTISTTRDDAGIERVTSGRHRQAPAARSDAQGQT